MSDGILWGYKQIADALGCSPRSVLDKTALPVDPLRLRRLGGKVWIAAERAEAWRRRHGHETDDLIVVKSWCHIADALKVPIRTAQRWAAQKVDPLPVKHGRPPTAFKDALLDWVDGQTRVRRTVAKHRSRARTE